MEANPAGSQNQRYRRIRENNSRQLSIHPLYLEFAFLRGFSSDILLSSRKRTKRSRKFFPSSPIPERMCSVKPESSNFEIFVVFLFLLRIASLPIDKLGDIFSKFHAKL
jgi:hypothetical protein